MRDGEGASACSLRAGLCLRQSEVAPWGRDTAVKPLAGERMCHPRCDPGSSQDLAGAF